MGIPTAIAVYLTLWWVVLFAILPIGVVTHAEAGVDKGDGGDPGAPLNPRMRWKFITTTWVSALIFIPLWAAIQFHLVHLPNLPG